MSVFKNIIFNNSHTNKYVDDYFFYYYTRGKRAIKFFLLYRCIVIFEKYYSITLKVL